jgi:hypothetical protein
MNKFSSDFWAKVAEVIGIILLACSFVGEKIIGSFYFGIITAGLFFVLYCLVMMFYKEFKRKG